MSEPLIHVNGAMVPKSEASVSVYDHGFLYGDGVFEGIRVYDGKIFKLGQHMDRLWKCAEEIRLEIPVSREEMIAIQRECVAKNNITNGYIRLVVSRGRGDLGLDPNKCPTPSVVCIADTITLYPPEFYESGMGVVLAQRPRIPIECLSPAIKSLNYLNNILAKIEAIDRGLHESIMLNTAGYVSECTGDNLFFIKDGKIMTPDSAAGMLMGVTRRFVMDTVAPACGHAVEEVMVRPDELLKADEIFLTGTAAEVIAVTSVVVPGAGGDTTHAIGGGGGEGSVTKALRAKFREIVSSGDAPED